RSNKPSQAFLRITVDTTDRSNQQAGIITMIKKARYLCQFRTPLIGLPAPFNQVTVGNVHSPTGYPTFQRNALCRDTQAIANRKKLLGDPQLTIVQAVTVLDKFRPVALELIREGPKVEGFVYRTTCPHVIAIEQRLHIGAIRISYLRAPPGQLRAEHGC